MRLPNSHCAEWAMPEEINICASERELCEILIRSRARQEQCVKIHNDPYRLDHGTFFMVPTHVYAWNDPGIIHDKNRLPKSARKQHPFAMNSPIWADHVAIKTTHPAYTALTYDFDGGEMTTELLSIGLLRGQHRPGLVEGSLTYVHARIHAQGDRKGWY